MWSNTKQHQYLLLLIMLDQKRKIESHPLKSHNHRETVKLSYKRKREKREKRKRLVMEKTCRKIKFHLLVKVLIMIIHVYLFAARELKMNRAHLHPAQFS